MAKTQVADIQMPVGYADYVREQSVKKNALFASGAISNVPNLAITKGGILNMPFVKQLSGSVQNLADNASLTLNKVATGKQTAVVNSLGNAWSVNDLSSAYAGEDFSGHVAEMLAEYWAGVMNDIAVATLKGVCANTTFAAAHVLDVSGGTGDAAKFTYAGVIDTEFKMGDARSKIAAWVAHPDVVAYAEKLELIQYLPNSAGQAVRMFRGKPIIEEASLTAASTVYTMFGVAAGALSYAEGLDLNEVEVDRDILAGDNILASRRSFVLHPQGFANGLAIGTNGETPTAAALATGTNWTAVAELKNIGIVAYKFKL